MTFQQAHLQHSIESDVFSLAKTIGIRETEKLLDGLLSQLNELRIEQLQQELDQTQEIPGFEGTLEQLSNIDINLTSVMAGE